MEKLFTDRVFELLQEAVSRRVLLLTDEDGVRFVEVGVVDGVRDGVGDFVPRVIVELRDEVSERVGVLVDVGVLVGVPVAVAVSSSLVLLVGETTDLDGDSDDVTSLDLLVVIDMTDRDIVAVHDKDIGSRQPSPLDIFERLLPFLHQHLHVPSAAVVTRTVFGA